MRQVPLFLSRVLNPDFAKLIPLLLIMLFDHTSLNITFPVLTFVFFSQKTSLFLPTESQTVRALWYGVCLSLPQLIGIFSTPLMSTLSDSLGRKKTLLMSVIAAFIFAASCALGIVTGVLVMLLLGKLIGGLFSRSNPIAQAIVADISTPQYQAENQGYLQVVISLGACIGPLLGGFLARHFWSPTLNFSLPFFFAAFLACCTIFLTWRFFAETQGETSLLKDCFYEGLNLLKNKIFMLLSFWLLLDQVAWSFYYQFMPPLLKQKAGFDVQSLGLFVGVIAFWLMVVTALGIRPLARRFKALSLFYLSALLLLVGLLLTVIAILTPGWLPIVWLASFPVAAGDIVFFVMIVTAFTELAAVKTQGFVMGWCFLIVSIVWAATGLFGGVLLAWQPILPVLVGLIFSGLLLLFLWQNRKAYVS